MKLAGNEIMQTGKVFLFKFYIVFTVMICLYLYLALGFLKIIVGVSIFQTGYLTHRTIIEVDTMLESCTTTKAQSYLLNGNVMF